MAVIRHFILLFILITIGEAVQAQGMLDKKVWQLSGLIVSKETREPVPFARIRVNHSRRGILANREGFYSIPVVEEDTLFFYSIGYQVTSFVIKDYLDNYGGNKESQYLYAINFMIEDSIEIPVVEIFPYDTPGELRTAIVEFNLPEEMETRNARENLDPLVMDALIENLDIDKGERIAVGRQLYYNQHQTRSLAPTATLFDPIAVYQLLKYINDKTKERKNKDLNYWEK